jgi:hypothetical protein
MERETSCFDSWLESLETTVRDLELIPALGTVSELALERYGARFWFSQMFGRRWSYIAGAVGDYPAPSSICRIPLTKNIGLVSDTWGTLAEGDRNKLVTFLERLITFKGTPVC